MSQSFFTKSLPGFSVAEKFAQIAAELFPNRVRVSAQTNVGSYSYPGGNAHPTQYISGKTLAENNDFCKLLEVLKSRPHVEISSISIGDENESISYHEADSQGGTRFNVSVNQNNPEKLILFSDALAKHFNLSRKAEILFEQLPAEQREMLRNSQELINDFATESARLSLSATKQAEDVANLLRDRTNELDRRFAEKEAESETRYRQKAEALELLEKEHAETVKAFELRNNTAVRRDRLEKIQRIISEQKQITISKGTIQKRSVIHAVCSITMLAAATICGFFAYKVLTGQAVDWRLFVPLSASTAIFVSTGIYYLKWNDRWFRDHATAEFANRRFAADILRASWLAELFFEWESKKETQFPPELLKSFAHGLFTSEAKDGSNQHPFDELSSVMKDLKSLRISKGGIEISKGEPKATT